MPRTKSAQGRARGSLDFSKLRADIISGAALLISGFSFYASQRLAERNAIISVRPALVFEYSDAGWALRNVGNGPALNVIVQHKWDNQGWSNPVRVPPLAAGATFTPAWVGHANVRGLGASYADIERRSYSSTTEADLTTLKEGNHFPIWAEGALKQHWNAAPLTE